MQLERTLDVADVTVVSDEHLEWALMYLVSAWLGKGGVAGTSDSSTKAFASRYGPGGGSPAVRWFTLVRSLASLRRRMRTLVVEHQDAIELLGKVHDTPKTAIYCDPPYIGETRVHGEYRHEFKHDPGGMLFQGSDDHDRLAYALQRFKQARIVVSYEDDPRLSSLYPGWQRRVIDRPKNMSNTGNAQRVREVLLVNGDIRP
ncbi:MAG: DNA adenine methylase [Phycisphaerales bacterium]